MNENDQEILTKWHARRSSMIRRRIQEEVESELEVESSLLRESTPFVRIKVHSIQSKETRHESCILTVWQPTEEQLSILKEGCSVQIQNLAVRESSYDGRIQLSANSRTPIESYPIQSVSFMEQIGFRHRCFLNLYEVHKLSHFADNLVGSSITSGKDFDVAAVQINMMEPTDTCNERRLYVTDETNMVLRIHCKVPLAGSTARGLTSDGNLSFIPLALCDLRIKPFDPDEQCAVAEFGELSSIATTNCRVEELGRWVAVARDKELQQIAAYCNANISLWDGGDQRIAFGYVVGLGAESVEKLFIEVDCCGQGLHKWEFPIHLLESMLSALNSAETPSVVLGPREESRVSNLGVLGPIFRARGVLWRFRLSSNRHHSIVYSACKANRAVLGRLYLTWH